ncbi:MAG: peptidoglycan bridge formation glycyltransferase FemA/FemB family protein, partial [Anaerolineae bacterium]|nr:peptidoglycan bridge formation glycyltransferase FemA/FemB family protein [Thermoflexales bacterium]MDW8408413.1 peptidoglycan bridge formation glycyltransferase FemA/FemB family protein [Anaerolineae bacterium]
MLTPDEPIRARREKKTTAFPAARWDAFVEQHPYGHFLQTNVWGELKAQHGWRYVRSTVLNTNAELVGGAVLLLRRLPFGLGVLAYAPRGPVANWDDRKAAASIINIAAKTARSRGAIALIVEPDLLDTPADRHTLTACGLIPLDLHVQPRRTIWVNLDVEEEVDILSPMKQKTRYNIGLARRKGVTVREGSADDLATFYALSRLTAERNEFAIYPESYYRAFLQLFGPAGANCARLFIAEHNGRALAALVVVAFGKRATYLYGASSNEDRDLMPTYLLQWEAMRWARERGCRTYDMWGVPDEDEETLEAGFKERSD